MVTTPKTADRTAVAAHVSAGTKPERTTFSIPSVLAAASAAFLSLAAVPTAMAATCAQGYLERYDAKGESYCVSVAQERTQLLRKQQMLRNYSNVWKQQLARDKRDRPAQPALAKRIGVVPNPLETAHKPFCALSKQRRQAYIRGAGSSGYGDKRCME